MEHIIDEVISRIEAMEEKRQIIVAIDGSCTSGKSTLASALVKRLDCNLFHMDDFFLRPEQRTRERLAETGGNVDYERFREEILLPVKSERTFAYRPYDCSTGTLKESVEVEPKRINIIEGTYSHHPYFGDAYDLKVFLKVSPDIREHRILQRPFFLQKRFFDMWIPMEQRYFGEFSIEENADLAMTPKDNQ